jgi:hypothetical protein
MRSLARLIGSFHPIQLPPIAILVYAAGQRSNGNQISRLDISATGLNIRKLLPSPMHFFPVNAHLGRRRDPDPDLIPIHGHDFDRDAAIDNNLFANFPSENEHDITSVRVEAWATIWRKARRVPIGGKAQRHQDG